jgi:hypothetical protein
MFSANDGLDPQIIVDIVTARTALPKLRWVLLCSTTGPNGLRYEELYEEVNNRIKDSECRRDLLIGAHADNRTLAALQIFSGAVDLANRNKINV